MELCGPTWVARWRSLPAPAVPSGGGPRCEAWPSCGPARAASVVRIALRRRWRADQFRRAPWNSWCSSIVPRAIIEGRFRATPCDQTPSAHALAGPAHAPCPPQATSPGNLMQPATTRTPMRPLRRAARNTLLTAVSLLACASGALAQTFYVDNQHPAASDAGPGTELQPYRTILAAATAHKGPGITILVKPGVYREQISVPASGAAGSPFVFRATGPGVVIDGSDALGGTAGWVVSSGTEYLCAAVIWTPKQVFVDGSRLAAYPPEWRGSLPANSFCYVAGMGLYVNLGGANPGSRNISASRRNHAFTMSSRSFVTLDGFTITRTNDRGINMNTCADGVIANNRVSFASSYGMQAVNCQRMRIEANVTTDAAMHGIGLTAGSTACIVRNNESARNAHPTTRMANGIYLYGAPGNTLSGNNLHHNQDTGMHFSSGSNDCVAFNNRSWANGDHGYDHLGAANVSHVHDVSFGNYLDGFSFEGNSPGGRVHNCISVDNGLVAGG